MDGSGKIVIGLGELLWDCFDDSRKPGGAPANVAFHAGQLGHRGVVCSRVGNDDLGRELIQYLSDNQLEADFVQVDADHRTGYVTVDTSNPDRPSYVIHEDVAWDCLQYDSRIAEIAPLAAAICFGTLAQRAAASRDTIHKILSAAKNALVVYDVNLRQDWYDVKWVERSMRASNVVKLNIDEVVVLADLLSVGSADPGGFAAALRDRYAVDLTCITRAEEGCTLIEGAETVNVPGVKVDVADAVGAGDAFTAALISARLQQWTLSKSAEFANRVGAMVAGQAGAMPKLSVEFGKLAASISG